MSRSGKKRFRLAKTVFFSGEKPKILVSYPKNYFILAKTSGSGAQTFVTSAKNNFTLAKNSCFLSQYIFILSQNFTKQSAILPGTTPHNYHIGTLSNQHITFYAFSTTPLNFSL